MNSSRNIAAAAIVALSCAGMFFRAGASEAEEGVRISERFGFDPEDSTCFIQEAINSGARKLIIDRKETPWIVRPIKGRSDLTLVFEKGVEVRAKKGEFRGVADILFRFENATNVFLDGRGAVLRMNKADYQKPPYAKAEWRSGLCFHSCENIRISGLKVVETGGDGLYLGDRTGNRPCRNVVVRRCIFENNHRQGVSVISADNLLIEDCIMRGTSGTAPQDGIDFEPNKQNHQFTRCIVRKCRFENNKGAGIDIHPVPFRSSTVPVDITFEYCYSTGNRYGVVYSGFTGSDLVTGRVRFVRCVFERECGAALGVFNKPARSVSMIFEDCGFLSNCVASAVESDILFDMQQLKDETADGVVFSNQKIVQAIRRPWFLIRGNGQIVNGVKNVFGNIEVTDVDRKTSKRTLDPDFWGLDVAGEGVLVSDLLKK